MMVISLMGGDWGCQECQVNLYSHPLHPVHPAGAGHPEQLKEVSVGLWGEELPLGAVAGVLGVDVIKVLTITGSDDPKLPMVVMAGGGGVSPLLEKFSRQAIASISTTSPSSGCSTLGLTFRKKGETVWGHRTPLDSADELESPLLPKNPSSQGGAEGSA